MKVIVNKFDLEFDIIFNIDIGEDFVFVFEIEIELDIDFEIFDIGFEVINFDFEVFDIVVV